MAFGSSNIEGKYLFQSQIFGLEMPQLKATVGVIDDTNKIRDYFLLKDAFAAVIALNLCT